MGIFYFPCCKGFPILAAVQTAPTNGGRMGKVKMTLIRALFAALAMLPLLAQQGAAQDYRLRSGDVVQIEVLEDSNLNRSAIVLPDGQISVPMAGLVRAAGRSLAQVQEDLSARLAPNFAAPPTVYVSLSELAERPASGPSTPRTLDIFVLGAAGAPGRIEVSPGTTLLQAIAQAGGLSPFAAKKRVQLRRVDKSGNEKVYAIDFDAIERGLAGGSMKLVDGDVIVVPQRRLFE